MRDACGELAERSEFFGLHQAILRGAQIVERLRQFPRALLNLFEQAHIGDGDDRLVGEGCDQFDLLWREGLHALAGKDDHTYRLVFAQQGNAKRGVLVAQ